MTKQNKTDLRVLRTQKSLCESFMLLCEKKSFEEISIQELCDTAMVRRATFYKHFKDKYDFFDFFVRYIQTLMLNDLELYSEQLKETLSTEDFFIYLFRKFTTFLSEHRKMVDNIIGSSAAHSLTEITTEAIQDDIARYLGELESKGYKAPGSIAFLSSFLAGGIVQSCWYWYKHSSAVSVDQIINDYAHTITRFLGTSK